MLVLLAHNGKTVDVPAGPSTRISDLQLALVEITGVETRDQILMYGGMPLHPQRTLGRYNLPDALPGEHAEEDKHLFLYSKQYLRPGSPIPPPEVLPSIIIAVEQESLPVQPHPLEDAGPLLRALPEFVRDFKRYQAEAVALRSATQQRHHIAHSLLIEVEVQGMAAEAARRNIDVHYNFMARMYHEFRTTCYEAQQDYQHMLTRFQKDMVELESVELVPEIVAATGLRHLGQLLPTKIAYDYFEECAKNTRIIGEKIVGQDNSFESIKADVEALLMDGPIVNLDQLGAQLEALQPLMHDQDAAVERICEDYKMCIELVERASRGGLEDTALLDSCQLMGQNYKTHESELLPIVRNCDAQFAAFSEQCLDTKNEMTRELMGQLQRISMQQSKIRNIKDNFLLVEKLLSKHNSAMKELLATRRLVNAYGACLHECRRRAAFQDVYVMKGNTMADSLARLRAKEMDRREKFQKDMYELMPPAVLTALGLDSTPAHYQISLPTSLSAPLADISEAAISRLPLTDIPGSPRLPPSPRPVAAPGQMPPPAFGASEMVASHIGPASADVGAVPLPLQLENARLRADLEAMRAAEFTMRASVHHAPPTSSMLLSMTGRSPAMGSPKSPGAAARTPDLLAEASTRYADALAAKEALIGNLKSQLASVQQQNSSYEERICALEALLQRTQTKASADSEGLPSSVSTASVAPLAPQPPAQTPDAPSTQGHREASPSLSLSGQPIRPTDAQPPLSAARPPPLFTSSAPQASVPPQLPAALHDQPLQGVSRDAPDAAAYAYAPPPVVPTSTAGTQPLEAGPSAPEGGPGPLGGVEAPLQGPTFAVQPGPGESGTATSRAAGVCPPPVGADGLAGIEPWEPGRSTAGKTEACEVAADEVPATRAADTGLREPVAGTVEAAGTAASGLDSPCELHGSSSPTVPTGMAAEHRESASGPTAPTEMASEHLQSSSGPPVPVGMPLEHEQSSSGPPVPPGTGCEHPQSSSGSPVPTGMGPPLAGPTGAAQGETLQSGSPEGSKSAQASTPCGAPGDEDPGSRPSDYHGGHTTGPPTAERLPTPSPSPFAAAAALPSLGPEGGPPPLAGALSSLMGNPPLAVTLSQPLIDPVGSLATPGHGQGLIIAPVHLPISDAGPCEPGSSQTYPPGLDPAALQDPTEGGAPTTPQHPRAPQDPLLPQNPGPAQDASLPQKPAVLQDSGLGESCSAAGPEIVPEHVLEPEVGQEGQTTGGARAETPAMAGEREHRGDVAEAATSPPADLEAVRAQQAAMDLTHAVGDSEGLPAAVASLQERAANKQPEPSGMGAEPA
eukprot:jgi/Botrbrau1/17568/Bobra.0166s0015.1